MKTVLVIGGGITGLSTIYQLDKWKKEKKSDLHLVLAESASNLGGKICTKQSEGFLMETGADSIVARKPNVLPFAKELGLENEIVYNSTGTSFIYTDGELKQIPTDSIFGIPMSMESLAKSTLVSAEGKVEALTDFYVKNDTFTKKDSIGEFLETFFGKELVEKQIAPVLSGVYSGKLSDLSIDATLPYLLDYKNEYGSIIKGLEANKEKFKSSGGGKFISFKNGLTAMIKGIEKHLTDVDILKETKATRIEKANDRYQVTFADGKLIEADHVVLSIPSSAAGSLFSDSTLQEQFLAFKNSSLISVYAGFDVPDSLLPENGTGFITANTNDLACNACTWTSRKWKHTSKDGNLLVRLFYKSSHPRFSKLRNMNEQELLQVALADVERSLGINVEPVVSEVTNWSDNMPNYQISHAQAIQSIEGYLSETYPGIHLAGSSYYGVGIPDCMENGVNTANKIIESLKEPEKP